MNRYDDIRVLVVADRSIVRKRALLCVSSLGQGVKAVAPANCSHQAIYLLRQCQPDILLVDFDPLEGGPNLLRLARARCPGLHILVLCDTPSRSADAWLPREAEPELLRCTLMRLCNKITIQRQYFATYATPSGPEIETELESLGNLLKQYISDSYNQYLSIATLAERFHYAQSYISRVFKQEFGVSPIQYQMLLRIAEAKVLLKTRSDLGVQGIAAAVGYDDAHYFSRIFHNVTGYSPSKWLTLHGNK